MVGVVSLQRNKFLVSEHVSKLCVSGRRQQVGKLVLELELKELDWKNAALLMPRESMFLSVDLSQSML